MDFTLWTEKDDTQAATPINGAILDNYYQQIKHISEERNIPLPQDWFATLLKLPDVMTRTEAEELDEEEWAVVRAAIEEAIGQLVAFRQQEGAALQKKIHRENPEHRPAAQEYRALRAKAGRSASGNA